MFGLLVFIFFILFHLDLCLGICMFLLSALLILLSSTLIKHFSQLMLFQMCYGKKFDLTCQASKIIIYNLSVCSVQSETARVYWWLVHWHLHSAGPGSHQRRWVFISFEPWTAKTKAPQSWDTAFLFLMGTSDLPKGERKNLIPI